MPMVARVGRPVQPGEEEILGRAWLCAAGYGAARLCEERCGAALRGKARRGFLENLTVPGVVRRRLEWRRSVRRGEALHGKARKPFENFRRGRVGKGGARSGGARPSLAGHGRALRGEARILLKFFQARSCGDRRCFALRGQALHGKVGQCVAMQGFFEIS